MDKSARIELRVEISSLLDKKISNMKKAVYVILHSLEGGKPNAFIPFE